ncbi:unnamed protein product [Leptidea sinapis]|uniref:2-methoxy-6-polyprenyl-1,4-benzoquinol methylase, mitochondrial n=1 Tax=Leptidea sinapis TaxID=189913 RepID=A0A5E4PT55_9NEOP|nr:unnamed protein product [Leptidea sinapis]
MALRKLLLENQLVSQHLRRCRQMCAQAAVKVENVNSTKHTHFGFQTISEEEKTKKVHEVFETVADKYDLMNDVMSFGIHRIWKDIFMQRLAPRPGTKLLDMAGGTGDITFRYINYIKNLNQGVNEKSTSVTGYTKDPCVEMQWLCADAEKLPLPDEYLTHLHLLLTL